MLPLQHKWTEHGCANTGIYLIFLKILKKIVPFSESL